MYLHQGGVKGERFSFFFFESWVVNGNPPAAENFPPKKRTWIGDRWLIDWLIENIFWILRGISEWRRKLQLIITFICLYLKVYVKKTDWFRTQDGQVQSNWLQKRDVKRRYHTCVSSSRLELPLKLQHLWKKGHTFWFQHQTLISNHQEKSLKI